MKDHKNIDKLSDKEWEALASLYSGEKTDGQDIPGNNALGEAGKLWQELGQVPGNDIIDVETAWKNVRNRINESSTDLTRRSIFTRSIYSRIAAAIILLAVMGSVITLIFNKENNIEHSTASNQSNMRIDLPDGSTVFLNRNSSLNYKSSFGTETRVVKLEGEAFFDIKPDSEMPFSIDAGTAIVKVTGTSFNVMTNNTESELEVFVKTGSVSIEEKSGSGTLLLEPGYIGRISGSKAEKVINDNPNYLAWNTGKLIYKGEELGIVFRDLKRVYDLNIVADDPSIYELPWTAPIEYQQGENIIKLICLSFDLSYTKDGEVYHLYKK